jgi:translation initiation factor 1
MPGFFDGTPLERPVTCEHCGKVADDCTCPRNAAGRVTLPSAQAARVRREKRRGKFVTVVAGLDPSATDLRALLKELRSSFGAGGSVTGPKSEPELELQGDHRDRVVELLKERGYPAKPAGG